MVGDRCHKKACMHTSCMHGVLNCMYIGCTEQVSKIIIIINLHTLMYNNYMEYILNNNTISTICNHHQSNTSAHAICIMPIMNATFQ